MRNGPSPIGRVHQTLLAIALLLGLAATATFLGNEPRVGLLIRNTLTLGLGATAISLAVGVLLAVALSRTDVALRVPLGCLVAAMLFMPLYLQAAGWDAGFGRQGWLSFARDSLAQPLLGGWRAAVWIHGMAAVAWVMLLVGVGLRYVEPELEEAALLETSTSGVFWRVTLRRVLPAIAVAALWVSLTVAAEMTVTDLYQVRTFAEEIYLTIPLGEPLLSSGLGVVAGIALLGALTLSALVAISYLMPTGDFQTVRHRSTFRLGRWRSGVLAGLTMIVLIVVAVPLINLVINAGLQVERQGNSWVRYWSFPKFLQIVASSPYRFREELGWTLVVAATAASVAIALAVPLAWLARRATIWSGVALLSSAACLATPGPLVGLAIIWLLNRDGSELLVFLYDRTITAPVMALVVRAFPLALLVSWYALRSISTDVLEVAQTEGIGALARFGHIAIAQRLAALTVAWLVAFAVAAGDLTATILVTPPGIATVPIRVFGLLHAGVDDQVAGLCLTTVAATSVLASATLVLVRRRTMISGR